MENSTEDQQGVTLIDVILGAAILAILVAIAVPAINRMQEQSAGGGPAVLTLLLISLAATFALGIIGLVTYSIVRFKAKQKDKDTE